MSERTSRRRALGAAAVVLVVVWLWPPLGQPAVPGLDHGYAWGLNEAHARGLVHGRDLVFPYGPLGWLLLAEPVGDNLAGQRIFQLASQALLAFGLALAFAEGASLAALLGFGALWLLAVDRLAIQLEHEQVLILALVLAPSTVGERARTIPGVLAGLWAVVLALAKTSLGVVAAALLAGWAAALAIRRPQGWRRALAGAALGATATLGVALFPLFGSFGNFLRWLGLERELGAGFSSAMSLPGTDATLRAGLLLLGAWPLAGIVARAIRSRTAAWWLAVLPAVAIVWKHGFVRQDVHVDLFLFFVAGLAGVAVLLARRAVDWVPLALSLVVLAGVASSTLAELGPPHPPPGGLLWSGRIGVGNLLGSLDVGGRQRGLYAESGGALAPLAWGSAVEAWKRNGETFDVLPWDLLRLPINFLAWRPNPLLQLYTAYTPRLDREVALHFAGARAPDHLLVHFPSIDQRQMLWETPATWETIAERYAPAAEQPIARFLVLDRRARALVAERREIVHRLVEPGVAIELPAIGAGEELTMSLDLRPTAWGRLRGALFRTEPVYVELTFLPGRRQTARLLPAQAGGELALDPPCRSLEELALWFESTPGSHPTRLRLTGPGLAAFVRPIDLTFSARRRH